MLKKAFPCLDILPLPQKRLWVELLDTPSAFTLYGGTALALHLGHRISIDFDFFSAAAFDPDTLLNTVPFLDGSQIKRVEPNTLTVIVDRGGPVQISFFGLPWIKRIEEPVMTSDIDLKVASLIDIAGTKASVIQKRAEVKDYIDIAALISNGITLPRILEAGTAIYGSKFNPMPTLKALAHFDDGNVKTLDQSTRRLLVDAVAAVDVSRLSHNQPTADTGAHDL